MSVAWTKDIPAVPQVMAVSSRNEAVRNFSTFIAARATALGVFAAVVPVTLHELGEDRYALLAIAMLIIGFGPLLDTGIGYALTYRYSRLTTRRHHGADTLLAEHRWFYRIAAISFGLAVGLTFHRWFSSASVALSGEVFVVAAALGAAVFFTLLSSFGRAVLVAQRRTHWLNLVDLSSDALRGVAILAGAYMFQDLGAIFTLLALTYAGRWGLIAALVARTVPISVSSRVRYRSLRASLALGAPFAVAAILTIGFGLLDKFLVTRVVSLSALAPYQLAYDLTTKGWMAVYAFTGAITPILMRWNHAREQKTLARAFHYSWLAIACAALIIYLPLNVFQPQIVGWWVGREMAHATRHYIFIFSLASAFYFVVAHYHNFLQARGRMLDVAVAYAAGMAVYASVLVFAYFRVDIDVAAFAHVTLWLTVALVMGALYRRRVGILHARSH